jgi:hypothetical protein
MLLFSFSSMTTSLIGVTVIFAEDDPAGIPRRHDTVFVIAD